MKNLLGALRIDLRRAFISPFFLATVFLIVLLNYISISQEYSYGPYSGIVYFYEMFVIGGSFSLVSMFLGIIPYGQSFCVDWKNQFIRSNVIRTTKNAYAWSKVISVALSAFGAVFIGYIVTLILFSLHMPMVGGDFAELGYEAYNDTVFGPLMMISPLLFLLVRICIFSFSCMFWAVFALLISSYYPNVFVVFSAPVITYYVVINSIGRYLPIYLRFNTLHQGIVDMGGPLLSFIYVILFFLSLSILSGVLFCRKVKRRLANG